MTCAMNVEIGAYVLHALEDHEAEEIERHLDGCAQCQEELRELEFTVSLLSLLSSEDLEQFEDASPGRGEHQDVVPRSRWLRAFLPLVAAVVMAAMSLSPPRTFDHPAPTAQGAVVRAADPTTHVRASVSVAGQPDGTRLHLSLAGAYPKGWCSLVAHSRDGRTDTAATWRADAQGTADVAGMTAIPADHLSELDVVTDTGVVLVTIPIREPHT